MVKAGGDPDQPEATQRDLLIGRARRAIDGRIPIPTHLKDRIAWITGTEAFEAWLFLVSEGRYKLLSDEQVQLDSQLECVRALVLNEKTKNVCGTASQHQQYGAAIVARLIPIRISPHKSGWRIAPPKPFEIFVPSDCRDPTDFAILLSGDGRWELWYTDTLKKRVFSPLPEEF